MMMARRRQQDVRHRKTAVVCTVVVFLAAIGVAGGSVQKGTPTEASHERAGLPNEKHQPHPLWSARSSHNEDKNLINDESSPAELRAVLSLIDDAEYQRVVYASAGVVNTDSPPRSTLPATREVAGEDPNAYLDSFHVTDETRQELYSRHRDVFGARSLGKVQILVDRLVQIEHAIAELQQNQDSLEFGASDRD